MKDHYFNYHVLEKKKKIGNMSDTAFFRGAPFCKA